MTGRGRPLRFLAAVALGWTGIRIGLIWSATGSLPQAIEAVIPFAAAAPPSPPAPRAASAVQPRFLRPAAIPLSRVVAALVPASLIPVAVPRRPDPARIAAAMINLLQFGEPEYTDVPAPRRGSPAEGGQPWYSPPPARWSASAWLVARPGGGIGAAPGAGQLGGSQAGLRVAWRFDTRHRLSLYARVTAPLAGKGREAALGVEWQPTRLPVRVAAEQRVGLDGTPGGPALGVVGGYDGDLAGFRLESYGQAGIVWRNRSEPYADGAIRAALPVYDRHRLRIDLGGGAWGAAQRAAARVDVGPSAIVAVPVGPASLRLAIDWRQRVAGDARPGSGPALTLGGDF